MDRLLVDYIPAVLRDMLSPVAAAQQTEVEILWQACDATLDDQFLSTATQNGVQRWENILDITPKGTDTLDIRRFRIQTRLNEQLPYTWNRLCQSLTALCGQGEYTISMTGPFALSVRLALTSKKKLSDADAMVARMAPANLVLVVDLLYNPHNLFSSYTHGQLADQTHSQLRSEVFRP